MIALAIALVQTAPASVPQWTVEPRDQFCKMTLVAPDDSGQFSVLADRDGGAGFFATSRTWPHRSAEMPAQYVFDGGKPVETEALWQGDLETGPQGHVHGFLAEGDPKFLDRFADSKQFGFAVFKLDGLKYAIDVQAGLETGRAAKDAVARLRACAKTLPKPGT